MTPESLAIDPSVQANTTAQRIQKALRILIISTCILFVALMGVTYYTYTTAKNNQDALCAYRIDLQSRIDTATQFLVDNPKGSAGLTPALLKANLANQKRAAKAFKVIYCRDN